MPNKLRALLMEAIEKGRAVHRLKDLQLTAVGLVDKGACQECRVVLMKRADSIEREESIAVLAKRAAAVKAIRKMEGV